ncbi:tetratricopeptide repeat protein [Flammeovirga sp. MY04]|uniref:caspase family protein n=1 Tax=Flammeovirga sp. MY04 TaxID=1191459 RepID=UPI0008061291|nr:caspase family protein [Flammeovirga sp. MY04]ANQ52048.1 tetratricopeptide repeat protein [Flammeovirga sp. MY04]
MESINKILSIVCLLLISNFSSAQTVEEIWEKHMKSARDWYELDEFDNALKDYIKAKETLPTDSVAYLEGAMTAAYAMNEEIFEKLKSEFSSVFKYTSPSFYDYSEILLQSRIQNQTGNLEQLYKIGLDKYPHHTEMYAGPLLGIYFENNQIDEAKALLENSLDKVDNPEFAYTLGVIYQNEGKIDEAIETYEKALKIDPKHINTNYNIGTIYYNQAVRSINRLNDLSVEEFETKSIEMNKVALQKLKTAKPYIDRAASDENKSTDAFEFLQTTLVLIDHVEHINETILEEREKDKSIISFSTDENSSSNLNETPVISTVETPVLENSTYEEVVVKTENKETSKILPAELMMSNLQFVYDNGQSTLAKGGSGKIKLRIENWGEGTSYKPTVKLLASMSITGLNYDRSVKLDDIAPNGAVDVEINVSYEKPNAVSRGFKAIKATQNKFRVMVSDSLRNRSEIQEFVLNLDQKDIDTTPAMAVKTVQGGKNYLVLIAANNYTSWTPLKNAVSDAENIKNVLLNNYHYEPENVYELYNEKVTKTEISKLVRDLAAKVGDEDKLLIYYSGHGYYDDFTQDGYWVPVDADHSEEDMSTYLPNTTILKYIKALKTKHTLLISDACYSGSMFSVRTRGMKYADRVESLPSRWGLASGGLTEVSDGEEGGHSPFNKYLTNYLRNNTSEKITIRNLAMYVRESVMSNAEQEPEGKPLKDVGHEGGEFVFQLRNYQ